MTSKVAWQQWIASKQASWPLATSDTFVPITAVATPSPLPSPKQQAGTKCFSSKSNRIEQASFVTVVPKVILVVLEKDWSAGSLN
jgi:hypothetical protein